MKKIYLFIFLLFPAVVHPANKIGDYEIKDINGLPNKRTGYFKYCDSNSLKHDIIKKLDNSMTDGGIFTNFFRRTEDESFNFIKSNKYAMKDILNYGKELYKNLTLKMFLIIAAPVISIIVGLIGLPIMVGMVCCNSCCGWCRYKRNSKYEKKFDVCKIFVIWSVLILSAVIIFVGSFWFYKMFSLVTSTKRLMCYTGGTFHDLLYGINKNNVQFAGLAGSNYLIQNLKNNLNKFYSENENYDAIKTVYDYKYLNERSTLQSNMKKFFEYSKKKKVLSCKQGAVKGKDMVKTEFLKEIEKSDYINNNIKKEYFKLLRDSKTLGDFSEAVIKFSDKTKRKKLNDFFDELIKTLDSLQTKLTTASKFLLEQVDYDKFRMKLELGFFIISTSIASVLGIYLFFMILTVKLKKCMCLNFVSKMIMFIKVLLGMVLSIISIFFILVAAVTTNVCWVYQKTSENRAKAKELIPENFYRYADHCIFENNGNFGDLLSDENKKYFNENLKSFNDINPLMPNTNHSIKKYDENYITKFKKKITSYSTFSTESGSEDFLDTYENNNIDGIKGALDKFKKDLGKIPKEGVSSDMYVIGYKTCKNGFRDRNRCEKTSKDPKEYFKTNYCIPFETVFFNDIQQRYGEFKPQYKYIQKEFLALKNCVADYKIFNKELTDAYTPIISSAEKIKNGIASLNEPVGKKTKLGIIYSAMEPTLKFTNDMKKGVSQSLGCGAVKVELEHLSYAFCGKGMFADVLMALAKMMMMIGPLFVLLGFCMCCQIRIADRDKYKMPAHMRKREQVAIEINELML